MTKKTDQNGPKPAKFRLLGDDQIAATIDAEDGIILGGEAEDGDSPDAMADKIGLGSKNTKVSRGEGGSAIYGAETAVEYGDLRYRHIPLPKVEDPERPTPVDRLEGLCKSARSATLMRRAFQLAAETLERHGHSLGGPRERDVEIDRRNCPVQCEDAAGVVRALQDLTGIVWARSARIPEEERSMLFTAFQCAFLAGVRFDRLLARPAELAAKIGAPNAQQSREAETDRREKADAVAKNVPDMGITKGAAFTAGGDDAVEAATDPDKPKRARAAENAYREFSQSPTGSDLCERPDCGKALKGRQRKWCSPACRKWGSRQAKIPPAQV